MLKILPLIFLTFAGNMASACGMFSSDVTDVDSSRRSSLSSQDSLREFVPEYLDRDESSQEEVREGDEDLALSAWTLQKSSNQKFLRSKRNAAKEARKAQGALKKQNRVAKKEQRKK